MNWKHLAISAVSVNGNGFRNGTPLILGQTCTWVPVSFLLEKKKTSRNTTQLAGTTLSLVGILIQMEGAFMAFAEQRGNRCLPLVPTAECIGATSELILPQMW